MKKIASFTINHNVLTPGMYVSRVDGDVITYDLRCKYPNRGDYLAQGALHTLEHLIATYVRSSALSDEVLYFGPMGCRTGFYLLLRDSVSRAGRRIRWYTRNKKASSLLSQAEAMQSDRRRTASVSPPIFYVTRSGTGCCTACCRSRPFPAGPRAYPAR